MYSYAKFYIPSLSRKLVSASIMEANFRDKDNEDKSGAMNSSWMPLGKELAWCWDVCLSKTKSERDST